MSATSGSISGRNRTASGVTVLCARLRTKGDINAPVMLRSTWRRGMECILPPRLANSISWHVACRGDTDPNSVNETYTEVGVPTSMRVLAGLFLVAATFAQPPAAQPSKPPETALKPEEKCKVSGQVVSLTTGEAVRRANLKLQPVGSGNEATSTSD